MKGQNMDEKSTIAIGNAIGILRTRQQQAELRIVEAINKELRSFENDTGLIASGISIEATTYQQMQDRHGRYFATGVRIQWNI